MFHLGDPFNYMAIPKVHKHFMKYLWLYTLKVLRMEDSKLVGTSMSIGHNLSKDDDSKEVN